MTIAVIGAVGLEYTYQVDQANLQPTHEQDGVGQESSYQTDQTWMKE